MVNDKHLWFAMTEAKVLKADGKNWLEWKGKIKAAVRTTESMCAKWEQDNKWVKTSITMKMDDTITLGLDDTNEMTAYDVWYILLSKYKCQTLEVASKKFKESSSLEAHFDDLHHLQKEANNLGAGIHDPEFLIILCESLPVSMENITNPVWMVNWDPDEAMQAITSLYLSKLMRSGKPVMTRTNGGLSTVAFVAHTPSQGSLKTTLVCNWCGWARHSRQNCYCPGRGKDSQQLSSWTMKPGPKHGSPAEKFMQENNLYDNSNCSPTAPTVPRGPQTTAPNVASHANGGNP
ncbi:hypothetical protein OE88DRAFT_1644323 [Heliocybe sulcata]|uniref:Uncharacterized protein n=1 Tax=Heliocybe sulcata TaxID=5364 RepID=A0A5C3N1L4_9AGAM|nr:hypothetical protein OE88DRAFT_1644323 [Heliocybe sulcata]